MKKCPECYQVNIGDEDERCISCNIAMEMEGGIEN